MKLRTIKRIFFWFVIIAVLLFSAALAGIYLKQDDLVQSQISELNTQYTGNISVGDVHLAPFSNFPDVSLKVDRVVIHETKDPYTKPILDVGDIYFGFNILDLISGNYDVHSIIIEDGFVDLVLHEDGLTNFEKAITISDSSEASPSMDIHLRKIELRNVDIHQVEEATNLDIETLIYHAKGGFSTIGNVINAHVDTDFELNVLDNGDSTYVKRKHFEFHTDVTFDKSNGLLVFKPSGIVMEHGDFELEGSIETQNEMTLDINIQGTKPNFDMLIAFAPVEVIPVLERYENAGKIYFETSLKGPTTKGRQPFIDAKFGAQEAYWENLHVHKKIDQMGFAGHFTNGDNRNFSTMEFSLTDISGNIEKGQFIGNIIVKNFEEPDIQMELDADFDLAYLIEFLDFTEVTDVKGEVEMHMKFHDVIDLDHPEKALNELNQAYFAELKIEGLSFNSKELPQPLHNLNAHVEMKGKKAQLDKFNLQLGQSNLSIEGFVSDLPAIVHHQPNPVKAHLEISSDVIDIAELTQYSAEDSTGTDERIENLSLGFSFNAKGSAFTEFKYLPKGEFYVDSLYADLKHYHHTIHDFHADILVKEDDLNIVDFTGNIDQSDFHFNGLIYDYGFWMQEQLHGDVQLDITVSSNLLKLENLFSYQGVNHVPKDYRHEEIDGLVLHMNSAMHYKNNSLKSIDVQLDKLDGKMHIHPLRFENFNGNFKYEDDHIMVEEFKGKMGETRFEIGLNYYLGKDPSIKKRDNQFSLKSPYIDFDALSNFNLKSEESTSTKTNKKTTEDMEDHAEAFNIYELSFPDMRFHVDVDHFMYHRLDLKNINARIRTTNDHYIHVDTFKLEAAGGHCEMSGYFNGSDPSHIYLKPKLNLTNMELDQLLFKFENFGQDAIVSENLKGKLTANITGNIRMYPDMVADLDQSEVHLDAQIVNGRIENYEPIMIMADYFADKDLTNIKFDTLANHMDINNGIISIPNMTIESTLGHMDLSGTQDMNDNIDYYIRIPWKLVTNAAKSKMFGAGKKDNGKEDEIVEVDPKKKVKYLNLHITGTFDDYKIRTGKSKK